MAKDNSFIQKKLFGPFKGLNGSQSPFLRELPPAPNARPQEFASEFENLIIDQKTQELILRYGIEAADSVSADPALLENQCVAGLFKWKDYDLSTGKARERFLALVTDELGVPTVWDYRLILTEVRPTSATLNGKSFAIIEDPDALYAKRFMIYNADGSVFASSTTLAGLANITETYVDYDADLDGDLLLDAVDVCLPTELQYNSANTALTTAVQVYSLARKGTVNGEIFLNDWVDSLSTSEAAYMTAAQSRGVMYFSGGGLCPILKYDGQNIYKAGMPNSGIAGTLALTEIELATWEAATGRTVTCVEDVDNGLVTRFGYPDPGASNITLGKAMYVQTFEHGDAKGNYIEGNTYIPAVELTSTDNLDRLKNTEPVTYTIKNVYDVNGDGDPNGPSPLLQYEPASLLASTGYDARGALPDLGVNDYMTVDEADLAGDTFTIAVNATYNTLKKGDLVCFRANLFANDANVAAGAPYFSGYIIPILITTRLSDWSTTTLTFDFTDYISVEIVPGADWQANSRGPMAEIGDPDDEITANSVSSSSEITLPVVPTYDPAITEGTAAAGASVVASLLSIGSWEQLFAWTWGGRVPGSSIVITEEFAVSNNLRVNVYRNKCDNRLGNVAVFDPVPNLYLLNIIPNNPFNAVSAIGDTFDNCTDTSLGAIFVPKTTLNYEDANLLPGQYLDDPNYTTLPKGRWISSYKGRLYVADDLNAENTLWRESLNYFEYFDVSDTLNMESPQGDSIQAVLGNDEAIFVLKNNSLKIILNDFTNTNIRVDELVLGDDGCIAPRSVVELENGVAYLTSTGPVWVQYTKELTYLGANPNGVSRIRDRLVNDVTLDLKRAIACVDADKQHYKLFIPKKTKDASGLFNPTDESTADSPDYTEQGTMFVFDYANDAWFEQSGINARGGMVISDDMGRMFYLTHYAKHDVADGSALEWALYRDRNYSNLLAYVDRIINSDGDEELKAIPFNYTTDWLSLDDPNEPKNFLRCKVYGLRTFDDVAYLGSSSTPVALSGAYSLTIKSYKDWRDSYVQSEDSLRLTAANLYDFMKCRTNRSSVMKFEISGSEFYSCPRIQAIEIEAAMPFKAKMKPWNVP